MAAAGTLSLKILDATVGLCIKPEAEVQGMDIHEHRKKVWTEFAGGISFTREYE